MTTAIIVDDKPANISTLEILLRDYCPAIEIIATATNIELAFEIIRQKRPAIIFLDIEMTGGNGFDLLRQFNPPFFETIFTTAYDQYAVRAFRENALDYLLKPIDIDALQQAVQKAEQHIHLKQTRDSLTTVLQRATSSSNDKIALPIQEGYLFVEHRDVVRCEASGSYSYFHMVNGEKIMVSLNLRECEDLLPPVRFFRVHRSHIVNLKYVRKYARGGSAQLLDGTEVTIAANKKEDFLAALKAC